MHLLAGKRTLEWRPKATHANSKGGGRGLQLLEKAAWRESGLISQSNVTAVKVGERGTFQGETGGHRIKGGSQRVFKKRSKSGEGSQWRIVNLENSIGPRVQRS